MAHIPLATFRILAFVCLYFLIVSSDNMSPPMYSSVNFKKKYKDKDKEKDKDKDKDKGK